MLCVTCTQLKNDFWITVFILFFNYCHRNVCFPHVCYIETGHYFERWLEIYLSLLSLTEFEKTCPYQKQLSSTCIYSGDTTQTHNSGVTEPILLTALSHGDDRRICRV